jgi:ATP-dependent Lon protease
VPDGATPKDGPSAGAAMTTAFVSALTGIPVRCDVAMTGEITLRGEVTAIGGLKEKLLAALRGGIKTVLIPEENAKDLQEIPDNVKNGLEIVPVKWIDQVLQVALERQPVPLTEEEVALAAAARAATPAISAGAIKH